VQQSAVLQPLISNESDSKIDAVLREDSTVMLKFSTWRDDLGWTCQKTIEVAPDMLDELHHAIAAMRVRVNRRKAAEGSPVAEGKLVDFPVFA
jgi:hypothetical protein